MLDDDFAEKLSVAEDQLIEEYLDESLSESPCEVTLIERFSPIENFEKELAENKTVKDMINNIIRATEACETSTKPECPENLAGASEKCL